MTGIEVDAFTSRLKAEMEALTHEERAEILERISNRDRAMRAGGQERPIWRGPAPEIKVLGKEIEFETDRGSRVGRAICFGIVSVGETWERSVIIHVPASGTNHEVPGSQAKLAGAEGHARMLNESEMAGRLRTAILIPIAAPKRPPRTAKPIVHDAALLQELYDAASKSPNVIGMETGSTCHKIVGNDGMRIYLFRSQMRCNLAGFDVEHKAVRCLTADEAKSMHLGSVRGQILFDDPVAAREAFSLALERLGETKEGR